MRTTSRLSVAESVCMAVLVCECVSVAACFCGCVQILVMPEYTHIPGTAPRKPTHILPFRIAHKTANLKMKTAGQAVMRWGKCHGIRGAVAARGLETSVCRIIHFFVFGWVIVVAAAVVTAQLLLATFWRKARAKVKFSGYNYRAIFGPNFLRGVVRRRDAGAVAVFVVQFATLSN